jgi:hypothetical protein
VDFKDRKKLLANGIKGADFKVRPGYLASPSLRPTQPLGIRAL